MIRVHPKGGTERLTDDARCVIA